MSFHFLSLILFFSNALFKTSALVVFSHFQSFLIILSHCHYYPVLGLYLVLFTQPVPFLLYLFLFGLSLYKFACLFLCFLVYFFIQACIFLSTLYLFYPKPLSKKTQPLFPFPSSVSGTTIIVYLCSQLLVSCSF